MYNMATIVDNTNTEYLDIVKSVNLEISLKKKKFCNYMWWQMLTRLTVIISQLCKYQIIIHLNEIHNKYQISYTLYLKWI